MPEFSVILVKWCWIYY